MNCVAHDQVEAMTLADRIVVLSDGYIEQVGAPMDLCEDPYFLFVARFIGPPAMNNMPATIEQSGAQTVVALQSGDHVKVPVASVDAMQGAAVHFGVRPEDLRLPEAGGGPPHGTVSVTGSLGEVTLGYMDSTGLDEPIIVKLQGNQVIKRGQQLSLDADSDKPHLFNGSRISPRHLNRPRNLGLSMLFVRDMFRSNINRNHNRNGHQSQICGVDGASRQTTPHRGGGHAFHLSSGHGAESIRQYDARTFAPPDRFLFVKQAALQASAISGCNRPHGGLLELDQRAGE
ncbi:TOBE domain-containing protein [Hoeflea sp.]|uniref:TOBE domain-containing protein n=1 Tax=Hoeflea sp. TaxID=1940281 RepID=UPI003B02A3E9